MKTRFPKLFKLFLKSISRRNVGLLSALIVFVSFSSPLFAGVLVGKDKAIKFGNIVEGQNDLSLQTQNGASSYPKESVLWYSLENDIDTFLKAGRKAKSDGQVQAATILLQQSLVDESFTKEEAQ